MPPMHPAAQPPDKEPPIVLLVDDEESILSLFQTWTESFGYRVVTASDAESALTELRGSPIDVVVCDIRMPGGGGAWLIDQVQTDFPGVPIIIATGLLDMPASVTLSSGVVGYLTKPFRQADLSSMLTRALDPHSPWRRDLRRPGDRGPLPDL